MKYGMPSVFMGNFSSLGSEIALPDSPTESVPHQADRKWDRWQMRSKNVEIQDRIGDDQVHLIKYYHTGLRTKGHEAEDCLTLLSSPSRGNTGPVYWDEHYNSLFLLNMKAI